MLEVRGKTLARKTAEFMRVRRAFAGALRSGEGEADIDARGTEIARGEHVAVCGGVAGAGSCVAGRRDDAGDSCAAAGRAAGARFAVREGRGAESDGVVQGARPIGGGDAGEGTGRKGAGDSDGGECG